MRQGRETMTTKKSDQQAQDESADHAVELRTLDGLALNIERAYCLICRREIMTESGHVCPSCSDETVKLKKGSDFC